MHHNRQSGNSRKTCLYFDELHELNAECPNVNPVATLSSSGKGDTRGGKRKVTSEDKDSKEEHESES